MTSKERILATLRGEIPDRVPISLYEFDGWYDDWILDEPSYAACFSLVKNGVTDQFRNWNLRKSKIWPDGIFEETWQEDGSQYWKKTVSTPKGDLVSQQRLDPNVHTVWIIEHWLKTPADIERWLSLPYAGTEYDSSHLAGDMAALGDRGLMMPSIGDAICEVADLLGFATMLEIMTLEPELFFRLMDFEQERVLAHARGLAEAARGFDMAVRVVGPEYATPPYMAPQMFERLVVDYDLPVIEILQDAGIWVRLHSHGNIGQVLEQIQRLHPDALDPIEPPPDGDIEFAEVKRRLGDKITLVGNVEERLLEYSTAAEIDAYVKQLMETGKPGGRFVLCPTAMPLHSPLQPKISDNIIAMVEAGLKYGKY